MMPSAIVNHRRDNPRPVPTMSLRAEAQVGCWDGADGALMNDARISLGYRACYPLNMRSCMRHPATFQEIETWVERLRIALDVRPLIGWRSSMRSFCQSRCPPFPT